MSTLADTNNNPGNIKDPATGTFKQFSTPQEGFSAMLDDLHNKITGNTSTGLNGNSTLYDLISKWAPSTDNNNPANYTANVATWAGVLPTTKLSDLQDNLPAVAMAMARQEGYTPAQGFVAQTQTTNSSANPSGGIVGDIKNIAGKVGDAAVGFIHGVNQYADPLFKFLGAESPNESGAALGINYDPNNSTQATGNTVGTVAAPVAAGIATLGAGSGLLGGLAKGAGSLALDAAGIDTNSLKDFLAKYLLNDTALGDKLSTAIDQNVKTAAEAKSIQDLMQQMSQEQLDDIRTRLSKEPAKTVKDLVDDPFRYTKKIQEDIKKSKKPTTVKVGSLPKLAKEKVTSKISQ